MGTTQKTKRRGWMQLGIIVASVATLSFSPVSQQSVTFEPPVPEQVVEPKVTPFIWQGGTVVLRVTVDRQGSVTRIEVVRPFPALTDTVVEAVEKWQFLPARLGEKPVESTTTLAVHVALVSTTPRPGLPVPPPGVIR